MASTPPTPRDVLRRGPRREDGGLERQPGRQADESEDDAVRCAACGHRVTAVSAAVAVAGAHRHTFVNPAGVLFEIGCFERAPGCLDHGHPTTEFSWFPGFAWSYALCGGCGHHLGWRFTAPGGAAFWGLILKHLSEG